MIGKYNGKDQVTCRNEQTNKHVLHYKQLNTFDHPYHIEKYLDSEPSTFLPVNVPKPFQCCQMNIHLFMSPTYGFLVGAVSAQGLQARLQ